MRRDESKLDDMWVISKGMHTDMDLSRVCGDFTTKTVVEHKISDIARYLLNPNPIHVCKELVGCIIHYHQRRRSFVDTLKRIFPKRSTEQREDSQNPSETLMSRYDVNRTRPRDPDLALHMLKITDMLAPFDPVSRRLSKLDTQTVSDIVGICHEAGNHLTHLSIQGSIDEKISYVQNQLLKDVSVVLEKANISDGLFEMKGFDFESFDPEQAYRLIKFYQDGHPKACVLGLGDTIEYWVDNIEHIQYLQLLELLLKTNPKLNDSLHLFTTGKAKPLKLLFNKELEIDYSNIHLPEIYRELLKTHDIELIEKEVVTKAISNSQIGISFNYIPRSDSGEEELVTNLSVMHNLKALERLKYDLPHIYSEIDRRSRMIGAGKFYLLDSLKFKGAKNE